MTITDHFFSDVLALNFVEGEVPEWVHLIPAGGSIRGVDGRSWTMDDAPAIIETFNRRGIKLPIDVEHATQIRGARGEEAPAVGYITALEIRNTGLWGKVEWNARGRELLTSRSYAYLSPVFSFVKSTGAIVRIVSAGLTNNPNLDLVALNREAAQQENDVMDKDVLEALGLNKDATAADAVTAINKLKSEEATARNRAENPDAGKFVPRADYDLALNKVRIFEEADKKRTAEAINTVVDAAVAAGKIAPASRDYHIAACRDEGGLERFQRMVEATPEIAGKSGLDGKTAEAKNKPTLTDEELATCRALNMSIEDYAAAKAAEKTGE